MNKLIKMAAAGCAAAVLAVAGAGPADAVSQSAAVNPCVHKPVLPSWCER